MEINGFEFASSVETRVCRRAKEVLFFQSLRAGPTRTKK
jgi:hypothetical protein